MLRKKYLIVMAAGHGTRMGSSLPKQFLDLDGRAILHRTIQKFLDACPDITVITVLPLDGDYEQWWKDYCIRAKFLCPQIIVRGGITRFHSVRAALEKVPAGAAVAIHDGVRPMLSSAMISRMFDMVCKEGGCRGLIPVLPTVDTLKVLGRRKLDDGTEVLEQKPGRAVDRSEIYGAQTPQIFCSEDIKAAYSQAYDMMFTDDASVADRYEIPLTFTEGERLNFKITSPDDLLLARAVLSVINSGARRYRG